MVHEIARPIRTKLHHILTQYQVVRIIVEFIIHLENPQVVVQILSILPNEPQMI